MTTSVRSGGVIHSNIVQWFCNCRNALQSDIVYSQYVLPRSHIYMTSAVHIGYRPHYCTLLIAHIAEHTNLYASHRGASSWENVSEEEMNMWAGTTPPPFTIWLLEHHPLIRTKEWATISTDHNKYTISEDQFWAICIWITLPGCLSLAGPK